MLGLHIAHNISTALPLVWCLFPYLYKLDISVVHHCATQPSQMPKSFSFCCMSCRCVFRARFECTLCIFCHFSIPRLCVEMPFPTVSCGSLGTRTPVLFSVRLDIPCTVSLLFSIGSDERHPCIAICSNDYTFLAGYTFPQLLSIQNH